MRRLSGGNVQKVLVGREIASAPTVLLTAYAVRGLDINSSYTIYDLINKQKAAGVLCMVAGLCAFNAPTASAETPVKVGFIFLHDENMTYDLNFMNGAKEACEAAGAEYILKTNIPEGQECYETALDLIDQGCNLIFADSFGHEDYLIQAAKECPDVQFCHATGTKRRS